MPIEIVSDNTTGVGTGTYSGVDDNGLQELSPTTNNGSAASFYVSKYSTGDFQNGVLKFTGLSNIPTNATVTSVTIGLYVIESGTNTQNLDFRRLLRDWVEAEATWNIYSTGNNWTTAGGSSAGNDRVDAISGSLSAETTLNQFYTVTQSSGGLVDDVQAWISGSASNYGWHIEKEGAGNDEQFKRITSTEGTDGNRPYLSVTYTVPAGAGEPATGQPFHRRFWGIPGHAGYNIGGHH